MKVLSENESAVRPATDREHLGTVAFGLWMTVGLFLDGSFHQDLAGETESFFTPWHLVFYSGFAATAAWLVRLSRRRAPGVVDWRLSFLPPGYGGARFGLLLFGVGGVGDALWHTIFGVERGIDALLSPTHLLLFAGLWLLLTAPVRAARSEIGPPPRAWLVTGAVVAATALVGFFVNFMWGLGISADVRVTYDAVTDAGEGAVIAGVASTVVTTLVLVGGVRSLVAATTPPVGAVTILFGTVALLVSAAFEEDAEGVVAAVVAGVVLDVLLRSDGLRRLGHGLTLALGAGTAVLWTVYLALLAVGDGVAWPLEIAAGVVVLDVLVVVASAPTRPVGASRGSA